jgi:hydrogenase maturation protease
VCGDGLLASKGAQPADGRLRTLVAGLGNELLMDDGVGIHVVRALLSDAARQSGDRTFQQPNPGGPRHMPAEGEAAVYGPEPTDDLPASGALVVEVGTALLDALHLLEWADRVIAVDAMQAGSEPGTVYRFGPDDVDRPEAAWSLHELGLVAALRLLPDNCIPPITIFGVQPGRIDYGLELTAPVAAAVRKVVAAVRQELASPGQSAF